MDHIATTDDRRIGICPFCQFELTDGYLVTGIGEVLWVTEEAIIPQFRLRYTKKSKLPDGVVMIQPTHHPSCKTKAMRCNNCGYIVIMDRDFNQ